MEVLLYMEFRCNGLRLPVICLAPSGDGTWENLVGPDGVILCLRQILLFWKHGHPEANLQIWFY
jgi:hypothetical protein